MAKRIQDLKSPTTRLRERVTDPVIGRFRKLTTDQRFWLGFILLSLTTTLLINNPLWHIPGGQHYSPGDVARESIVSPADIYFTDDGESHRLQNEARESVKPIFRFESGKAEQAVQRFLASWETLQRHGSESATNTRPTNSDIKTESHWVGAGGSDVGRVLSSRSFSRNELEAVESALRESAEGYIYDDSERQFFQNQVAFFDLSKPNLQTTVAMPESSWISL
jgi:hypothetical protein